MNACNNCGKFAELAIYRGVNGGETGKDICRDCWDSEMNWRTRRNAKLSRFDRLVVIPWPHMTYAEKYSNGMV